MEIKRIVLTLGSFAVNGIFFIPAAKTNPNFNKFAIFTHGYTSHKGDVLSWAHRMAFAGLHSAIFDLPGHYLGSFNEVNDFNEFTNNSHLLFLKAFEQLHFLSNINPELLILGGHSLGSYFSLLALDIPELANIRRCATCVGSTYSQKQDKIFLESDFYHDTLKLREQLVSPCLRSSQMFPWIKERISLLSTQSHKIHLITGEDDIVATPQGTMSLYNHLKNLGNDMTLYFPNTLPHHRPELAASFIYSYLKKEKLIS